MTLNDRLRDAARRGDLAAVKLAIAEGYGRLDIAKYLVEHGANIRARDDFTIPCAKEFNQTDVVDYLEKLIKEKQ